MELRHLRYFVAVAEAGTIARAAERLHISESPLSRQIVDLEHDLGVLLFERLPRGMRLTSAGAGFLADARQVLADVAAAAARAQSTAERVVGTLRVGYSETPGPAREVVRAATLAFRDAHPGVRLTVQGTPQRRQLAEVRSGDLDVGFAFEVDDPALASEPLAHVAITGVVVPASHVVAGQTPVSLAALGGMSLLSFPHALTQPPFPTTLRQLQALGAVSEPRDDVESASAGFTLIGFGEAWAVGGEWIRPWLPDDVAFCPVPGLNVPWVERMVWRHASATPALLAFVDAVVRERDRASVPSAPAPLMAGR